MEEKTDSVLWAFSTNADNYFRKLGYKGKYPDYVRTVPGRVYSIKYELIKTESGYKPSVLIIADGKPEFDGDKYVPSTGEKLSEKVKNGDIAAKKIDNLPQLAFSSDKLGDLDMRQVNGALLYVPVADKIAASLKLSSDSLTENAEKKKMAVKAAEEYAANLNSNKEDYKKALEEGSRKKYTSGVFCAVFIGIIAYIVTVISAFAYMKVYCGIDNLSQLISVNVFAGVSVFFLAFIIISSVISETSRAAKYQKKYNTEFGETDEKN